MKNKEIEELLNMLNKCAREDKATLKLNEIACKTILSYIKQLKKRNKELYEGFMATQEELTDYATENEQLEKENKELKDRNEINIDRNIEAYKIVEQLENNRDKAIELIDLITPELWNISNAMTYKLKDIKYILKGDSDDK